MHTYPDRQSYAATPDSKCGGLFSAACIACRAYATSMTSVRPSVCTSVTLVDCDHDVQQKVESDRIGLYTVSSLRYLLQAVC